MDYNNSGERRDFLSEEERMIHNEASRWQRFFNFLIDTFVIAYSVSFLTTAIFEYLFPEWTALIPRDEITSDFLLLAWVTGVLNYMIYYTLSERYFLGITFGKLITGTKAIREDGANLSLKDAAFRSIVRCVPFEVLSIFDRLWHDKWTKTIVIKTRSL